MKFLKFSLVLGLLFCGATAAFAQEDPCSSPTFQNDVKYDNPHFCAVDPDLVEIRIYKLALCRDLPTVGDTSSCEVVYSDPAGKLVSISGGSSAPLAGIFELSYDSYPYVYVMIDNHIAMKSTFTLPAAVGVYNSSGGQDLTAGYGDTCWTNGRDAKEDHTNTVQPINLNCGSSPNPQLSNEYFKSFTDDMLPSVSGIPSLNGDTFDAYLVNSTGALATITNNGNNILTSSDADKIVLIQHSAVPLVVNDTTTNIDIGFATSNRLELLFVPCTIGTDLGGCAAYAYNTGFEVNVTAR